MPYFRGSDPRVVCGSRTSLALDKEGRVFSWGKGEDGTLGIGERGTVMKPRLVTALLRHPISLIACRGAHVLALDTRGHLWAWGRNDDGQLGVRRDDADDEREKMGKPPRVQALGGRVVTAIGCGRTHSVALTAEGELYSWGCGDDGVLGHGDTRSRPTPTRSSPRPSAGSGCARSSAARGTRSPCDGGVLCSWGWGVYGQLGHGDMQSQYSPRWWSASIAGV